MKKAFLYRSVIASFLLFITSLALSIPLTTQQLKENASFGVNGELQPINRRTDGGRSAISFYKDDMGNKYILKQNNDLEATIQEAFAAHIGASIGLPVNKVKIIPAHTTPFNNDKTATFHTVVPGIEVARNEALSDVINIFNGLNQESLETLKTWPDLIPIVAFDIFINNCDRHNYNLFVDKNKSFYAIDLDYSFHKASITKEQMYHFLDALTTDKTISLPKKVGAAAYQVKDMYHDNVAKRAYEFITRPGAETLSDQDKHILTMLHDTLQQLYDHYGPRQMYALWMKYAKKSGYHYSVSKKMYIASLLAYNHYYVGKLLKKLKELVAKIENI